MEFADPWFMAAGGALVSSPILIHLINRMRFKRIRWAAMEFLLKSQKRNRRKLIIEQLILLALRCLLVMLAGLLLGRLRLGGDTGQNAFHLVVIDDTPSMGDRFVDERSGKGSKSFEVAKDQVKLLADTLAQASTPQEMRVVLLSDPNKDVFPGGGKAGQQLNKDSITVLAAKLKDLRPASVHVDPVKAVEKAREVFPNLPRGKKVLHFVSDFRERDWKTGPDVEALGRAVDSLTATGAHVSLIDVADAPRGPSENIAAHPNLSIEELRSTAAIATEDAPVEFTIGVFNHSTAPTTTFLHVFTRSIYVNDKGEIDDSEPLKEDLQATGAFTHQEGPKDAAPEDAKPKTDALPPGQLTEHKFQLVLQKKRPRPEVKGADADAPEERARQRRADAEFVQVRVQIEDNPTDAGLEADNVRDVVVALVRKIPVLVVDGAPDVSRKKNGDLWHLRRALDAAVCYDMDRCTVEELDKINLDQYPDVFLVNVSEVKNKETVQKLADYAARGGSVAYFLGDKALPEFYNRLFSNERLAENDKLFSVPGDASKEQHLFPVLLESDLPPAMSPKEMEDRLQNDKQPKILFPDESHPLIRGRPTAAVADDRSSLAKNANSLRYLMINRYWKCQPRSKWDPEPYQAQEVVVLPNRDSIDRYKRSAQDYMDRAVKEVAGLVDDVNQQLAQLKDKPQKNKAEIERLEKEAEKWGLYHDHVKDAQSVVVDALGSPYLDDLIRVLDDLMNDPGVKDDPKRPNMPELWAQPRMRGLKDEIDGFRNKLKYGDPLVVTRPYGKGRVLAFLTTAGTSPRGLPATAWNDWGVGVSGWSYPVFVKQMQEYLISTSESRNRIVGTDLMLPELDANGYRPDVRRFFQPQPAPGVRLAGGTQPSRESLPTLSLQPSGSKDAPVYQQTLRNLARPGVYTFEFVRKTEPGETPVAEVQAYAFNIDTVAESDLNRASKEVLLRKPSAPGLAAAGRVVLRSPGDSFDEFKDPPPELSNMIWLFLLIGLVFVVEQALAVHLSFHLKEGEAALMSGPAARKAAA